MGSALSISAHILFAPGVFPDFSFSIAACTSYTDTSDTCMGPVLMFSSFRVGGISMCWAGSCLFSMSVRYSIHRLTFFSPIVSCQLSPFRCPLFSIVKVVCKSFIYAVICESYNFRFLG